MESPDDDRVSVEVEIFGEVYRIRADRDPDHIRRLATTVDDAMREVAETIPRLGVSRVAVVAALNLADRLDACRRQVDQLTSMLEHQLEVSADGGDPDPGEEAGSCPETG